MIVINFTDPSRGFRRIRGDRMLYDNMASEEYVHIYDGETLTGIIKRSAIDSVAVDERDTP